MRILVAGCGAIGAIYAGYLSRVAAVTAFDVDRAHVAAIERDGLQLSGRSAFTAPLRATADPGQLAGEAFDVVLVMVKSTATAAAFDGLRPFLRGEPLLATLQNGMDNVDALAARCSWDIAHGVSTEAARVIAPGRVEHFIHGEESWIGPARGSLARVERLAVLLNQSGMPTRLAANPLGAVWAKFIFNCVMNPLGAIVLGENRARYQVPEMCDLIDAMFAECIELPRVQGIELPFDPMGLVRRTRSGELALTRHAGSMAADLAAGRDTELEVLTGWLVRKARALGVPVPVTEAVYRLAKGVEYATRLTKRQAD